MPTERKVSQVKELQEKLGRCTIAVATNPTGLGVNAINDLRQRLREKGVEYRVVKNTLAYLAAEGAGVPQLNQAVQGPTAVAFGYQDPAEAAAALQEYIRATRSPLTIRGGILGSRSLTAADVATLATLPSREVMAGLMLAQLQVPVATLLGQLQLLLHRLLAALNDPLSRMAFLLQQRTEQLGAQEAQGEQ